LGLCEKYGFVPKQVETKTATSGPGKLDMMVIDTPVDIESGKEETYSGQNIRLLADINCKGKLAFEYCVLIYNSANLTGKICTGENGEISIANCVFIDTNKAKFADENPGLCGDSFLFTATNKNRLFIENSLLYDCKKFGKDFAFDILNSIIRYSNMPITLKKKSQGSLSGFLQTLTGTGESNFISLPDNGSKMSHCLIENVNTEEYSVMVKNMATQGGFFTGSDKPKCYPLFQGFTIIESCTFRNIGKCLLGFQFIKDSVFENCLNAIADGNSVKDSLFRNCKNVIQTIASVENSQFLECSDDIIFGARDNSPLEITGCTFYNITSEGNIITFYHNGKAHLLRDCIFDGLHTSGSTVIDIRPGEDQSTPVSIENCEFHHCSNGYNDTGEDFIHSKQIETSGFLGKQEKTIINANIKDCTGLDAVNKDGDKAKEIKIRDKTKTGEPLGMNTDEGSVGIPGFDYAAVPASKPVLA
jgi:hypothetical protein